MICPKCHTAVPDDSVFCFNCGCNIAEAERLEAERLEAERLEAERRNAEPVSVPAPMPEYNSAAEYAPVPPSACRPEPAAVPEKAVAKHSKAPVIVLSILLAIAVIGCVVLGITAYTEKNFSDACVGQMKVYSDEIDSLSSDYERLETEHSRLQKSFDDTYLAQDVLTALEAYENWGYASNNFRTSASIVHAKLGEGVKSFELTMNYQNSTCTLDNSDLAVVNAYWSDKTWYYGETITVYIEPLSKGISVLTFTNDAYDNVINVLVIVD